MYIYASLTPVVRSSDDEVGMFDTVNQVFYANDGTGDFVAGAPVQEGSLVINFINDTGYITDTELQAGLATKQNTLTAGDGIDITSDTISTENIVWRVW